MVEPLVLAVADATPENVIVALGDRNAVELTEEDREGSKFVADAHAEE